MSVNGPGNVDGVLKKDLPVQNTVPVEQEVGNVPVGGALNADRPGAFFERPEQAQMEAEFEKSGFRLTKEQNKAYKKDNGIGTTVLAKMVGNNGLSFKHTARTHDKFAKEIFELAYETGDPNVMQYAKYCIEQMPKGARKGDITGYTSDCRAVLKEFKGSLEHGIIQETVVAHEEASEERHQEGEMAADLRAAGLAKTTVETGEAVAKSVNANTDARAKEINQNVDQEGAATRKIVQREGQKTRAHVTKTGEKVTHNVTQNVSAITGTYAEGYSVRNDNDDGSVLANGKQILDPHTTKGQIVQDVTKNTSAMLGVDAEGYNHKDENGNRKLANGEVIADKDSAVGQIKAHTTGEADRVISEDEQNRRVDLGIGKPDNLDEADPPRSYSPTVGGKLPNSQSISGQMRAQTNEIKDHVTNEHEATRAHQTQNAKLTAKRQTLSDMLTHEDAAEWGGIYRDSTIQWLGGAADKVIGDANLSPEQKEKAMDELIRMADEELWISDGDKDEFNNTYFPQPKK